MSAATLPASPGALTARQRNLVLGAMCLCLVLVVSGVSMLNNSLPEITEDLGLGSVMQTWVVDAYALPLAALLLFAGALGDRFGRRPALVGGIAIYGVAAGLAATTGSGGALIVFRALMGVGAALIMPGTLSTITSVFPPEERPKAVGIWAGFAGAGGTLGLIGSGLLLQAFSWESVFVATAIVSAIALIAVVLTTPATRSTEHVGLDPAGSLLSVLGIGFLVFGIIEGPERGWTDPLTMGALIGGGVILALFVLWELRSSAPLLDPRLFRYHGFATGSASLFLLFFAMFGFFFVSMQFLQLVLGYSPLKAALSTLPMTAIMLPLSAAAPVLAHRFGQKRIAGSGLVIGAAGFFLFATIQADSTYWYFLFCMFWVGLGISLAMAPATNAIVASLPREKQGVASAVNDTARELGAAFGVAMLASAFTTGYRNSIGSHLAGLPEEIAHGAREAPAIALQAAKQMGARGTALADAAKEGFANGTRYALAIGGVALLLGALYVFWKGPSRIEELVEDLLDTDGLVAGSTDVRTEADASGDPVPVAAASDAVDTASVY